MKVDAERGDHVKVEYPWISVDILTGRALPPTSDVAADHCAATSNPLFCRLSCRPLPIQLSTRYPSAINPATLICINPSIVGGRVSMSCRDYNSIITRYCFSGAKYTLPANLVDLLEALGLRRTAHRRTPPPSHHALCPAAQQEEVSGGGSAAAARTRAAGY